MQCLCVEFGLTNFPRRHDTWRRWLVHLKRSSSCRVQVWRVMIAGVIYSIWRERNNRVFSQQMTTMNQCAYGLGAEVKVGSIEGAAGCE